MKMHNSREPKCYVDLGELESDWLAMWVFLSPLPGGSLKLT